MSHTVPKLTLRPTCGGLPARLVQRAGLYRCLPALWLCLAVVGLLASMPVKAETLYGRVTHVADGDTVTLLLTGEQPPRRVTIRLAQIDAPEVGRGQPGQPFGAQSRNSLRELCFGKLAQGIVESADRYGRTVARLTCEGTPDVNLEQVRRGFAWAFDRYVTDATIVAAHATARAQRVGLWRETAPIAPWEWRKAHSQPLHGGAAVAQK